MLNSKLNCVFWAFPGFFSSTKHDLAISYFQLWPIIGEEGDNISKAYFRYFVTLDKVEKSGNSTSYNFQSRRQIMTQGGVYSFMTF